MHTKVRTLGRTGPTQVCYVWLMILAATLILFGGTAYSQESPSEQRSLSEVSQELTNPVSNVWSMFTEFDSYFLDGDLNKGGSELGGRKNDLSAGFAVPSLWARAGSVETHHPSHYTCTIQPARSEGL